MTVSESILQSFKFGHVRDITGPHDDRVFAIAKQEKEAETSQYEY